MKGGESMKTRIAYGEGKDGKMYKLCDTIEEALKANMMYRDYEAELIKMNPQLKITFKIEKAAASR